MQPAEIAIELRRRSPWEAMDLGLSMLQRWWRLVYGPHLLVWAGVTGAALAVGGWLSRPWVALLLLWWMKPLADRVALHVLSRAVFGEEVGLHAALSQSSHWRSGLASSLLFRWWPELARSFYLPVRQLEGQHGREARARRSQLGRRMHGYALWLTLACLLFEWLVLYLSFNFAAGLFLPAKAAEGKSLWEVIFAGDFWTWDDVLAYSAAVALLEPFYAAAGFALYLNRRSGLEGWDIEVALRRIAKRYAAAAGGVLLALFLVLHPEASYAQKDPRHEIREVLKAPEFPHETDGWRWRARDASDGSLELEKRDLGWLEALMHAISTAARAAMWIAAILAVGYVLWWAARFVPRARAPQPERYQPPAALFGMELAPETLPPDVAAAALSLAAEGRPREALGLLYRGALSHLVHRRGVMLLASHTEGEVLSLSPAEHQAYLGELIEAWRRCAYARQQLQRAEVERLAQAYGAFAGA